MADFDRTCGGCGARLTLGFAGYVLHLLGHTECPVALKVQEVRAAVPGIGTDELAWEAELVEARY